MRSRMAERVVALVAASFVLSACGDRGDGASDVVDGIAERGVAAYAAGRWRCETDEDDGGNRRHLTTIVAVGANGRFTYEVVGEYGPQVGTWSIEGLQLRLAVPWDSEGRNGFYQWVHDADADPPTHLRGRRAEPAGEQELDVEVSKDHITIVQHDEPELDGPNYDWDVTCRRESTDSGEIPPTVPASGP